MTSRLKRYLLLPLVVCISVGCVCGCSSQPSSDSSQLATTSESQTDKDTTDAASAIAISDTPAYRLVGSVVRDGDKESRFKYDDHNLVADLTYRSTHEYTYKDGGLTREEYDHGEGGTVPGTSISKATVDELGRITKVNGSIEGFDTSWVYTYSYYEDTMKLKTMTEDGSWIRTVEYNEDGYVTSITLTNPNTEATKSATFTYEDLGVDEVGQVYGMEYTDFDGNVARFMIGLDENGNIQTIYDGATYVDYLYEEVKEPSAWIYTETNRSQALLGYTTRTILDTEQTI